MAHAPSGWPSGGSDRDAFLRMSVALNSTLELKDVCATACRIACETLGVSHSTFVIFEPDMSHGTVFAEYPVEVNARGMRIPLSGIKEEEPLLKAREPIYFQSVDDLNPGVVKANLERLNVKSVLVVPVVTGTEVLGSFSLDSIGEQRIFSADDIAFCRAFAAQIAVAIKNARGYEAMQQRATQLDALRSAVVAILGELDKASLLQTILQQAIALLNAPSGGIYEYDSDKGGLSLVAVHGTGHRLETDAIEDGVRRLLLSQADHSIISTDDARSTAVLAVRLMRSPTKPLGVLYVAARDSRSFSRDAQLLTLFAEPAALALVNSEIIAQRDRLNSANRYRSELLQNLEALHQYLPNTLEDVELRARITQSAVNLVGWKGGCLYIHNSQWKELQLVVNYHVGDPPWKLVIKEGDGHIGSAATQRAVLLVNASPTDQVFAEQFGIDARVAIVVPLITDSLLDSVLVIVDNERDHPFLDIDREVLVRFAERSVTALQARGLMYLDSHKSEARVLDLIGGEIRDDRELRFLLHALLTVVTADYGLRFNRALLFLMNDEMTYLEGEVGIGQFDQQDWEQACTVDKQTGSGRFDHWLRTQKTTGHADTPIGEWIRSVRVEPRGATNASATHAFAQVFVEQEVLILDRDSTVRLPEAVENRLQPSTPVVIVPLVAPGEFVGLLVVDNKFTQAVITQRDVQYLKIYARTAALAVGRFLNIRRNAKATNSVVEAINALSSLDATRQSDSETVLENVLRQSSVAFQASYVLVSATDSLGRRRRWSFSRKEDVIDRSVPEDVFDSIQNSTWPDDEAVIIDGSSSTVAIAPQGLKKLGIHVAIRLALRFGTRKFGELWIGHADGVKAPAVDQGTLLLYATQVGIVYENSQRLNELEKRERAARKISGSIDPQEVAGTVVREACDMFDAECVTFWPYRTRSRTFVVGEFASYGQGAYEIATPKPNGRSYRLLSEPFYFDRSHISMIDASCTDFEEFVRPLNFKSVQGVTLRIGSDPLGVLYLTYREPREFGDRERRALEEFANFGALAMRMARSIANLRKALDAAQQVGSVMVVRGNVEASLVTVAQKTCEAIQCDFVMLFRFDQDRSEERTRRCSFPPITYGTFASGRSWEEGDASDASRLVPILADRGGPTIATTPLAMEEFASNLTQREKISSAIAIPLNYKNRRLGLMLVNFRNRQDFSEEDIHSTRLFADQAAVALAHAHRFEALTALSQGLLGVSRPYGLGLAVQVAAEQLQVDCCSMFLLDEGRLRLVAQLGWPHGHEAESDMSSFAEYTVSRCQPVIVSDFSEFPDASDFVVPQRLFASGIVSGMSVPVMHGDDVFGAMLVHVRSRTAFAREDVDFLSLVANQVVIAERSWRRYEELSRQSRSLVAFYEAAKTIVNRSSFDEEEILSEILEQAVVQVVDRHGARKTHLGTIHLLDEDGHSLRLATVRPPGRLDERRHRLGGLISLAGQGSPRIGLVGRAALERRIVRTADVRAEAQYIEYDAETISEMAAPLADGDSTIGVLNLESPKRGAFDEQDEMTIQILAELAVIAIKQARVYRQKAEADQRLAERKFMLSLARTAHELRQPGSPLSVDVHSLLRGVYGDLAEQQRVVIRRIEQAVINQVHLIDNVRYCVQIIEGRLAPRIRDQSIQPVVEQAVSMFRFMAERKDITLELVIPPSHLPHVCFDRQLLESAVHNLVENAIEFNDPGGSVRIGVEADGEYMLLRVADSGWGIPAEERSRIFEQFHQVAEHRKKRNRGLGVGLSICQAVVQLHGGRITVESELGRGSVFTVALPLAKRGMV